MIDLDPLLHRWHGSAPWETPLPDWCRSTARASLAPLSRAHRLTMTAYEPPDEEWVCVRNSDVTAVVSTLFPLAFVSPGMRDAVHYRLPQLAVVPLESTVSADYRASPPLLAGTLLRFGWTRDFSPSCFSVSDLLIESMQPV